jgi:hypothetical protein
MRVPLHAPSDRSAVFHLVANLIGVHTIYMFLLLTYAFSHSHETLTLPLLCPNGSCACTHHDTNPPWYKLKASCCGEGIPKRCCNDDTMVWIFSRYETQTWKQYTKHAQLLSIVCSASKVTTRESYVNHVMLLSNKMTVTLYSILCKQGDIMFISKPNMPSAKLLSIVCSASKAITR